MAALVLPVVRGGVEHAQVGRGRRVEELGDLLEGVGVGVVGAAGERVGPLLGQRRELGGRLVGQGIPALDRGALEGAVVVAAEGDPAVVGEGLVRAVPGRAHHVDDRVEPGVEQHVEGRLRLGPVGVGKLVGTGRSRLRHGAEATRPGRSPHRRWGARLSDSRAGGYCFGFGAAVFAAPSLSQLTQNRLLSRNQGLVLCAHSARKPPTSRASGT